MVQNLTILGYLAFQVEARRTCSHESAHHLPSKVESALWPGTPRCKVRFSLGPSGLQIERVRFLCFCRARTDVYHARGFKVLAVMVYGIYERDQEILQSRCESSSSEMKGMNRSLLVMRQAG